MASDLDKYLSDLGIDTEDEAQPNLPTAPHTEAAAPAPSPAEGGAAERLEAFLVGLLLYLDPGYAVEVIPEGERELRAEIVGGDAGKIIGRGGRTLAALEYLANAVLNRDESGPHVRVSLDVGGYRARRDERLRGVALKAAARARKTGLAVELEPMSAAERRVIHMTLADDPSVESASSGEGRERRVVVRPVG
jgi:spoIIIJ-associated protein